jgi:hypothetical protein
MKYTETKKNSTISWHVELKDASMMKSTIRFGFTFLFILKISKNMANEAFYKFIPKVGLRTDDV